MASLAPSLRNLFRQVDGRWPHRDRRTDGWASPKRPCTSVGHCPGARNLFHAIDVDRDGIDPYWIVDNIKHDKWLLWYIIWNKTIWSNTYNFRPLTYRGSNPHTDHLHIEIYQNVNAENYTGPWWAGASGADPAPPGGTSGFGAAWDSSPYAAGTATHFEEAGRNLPGWAAYIDQIR